MRAQFRNRIRFVLAGVVFIALLIVIRLYFVQIVHEQDYAQKADRQFASGSSGLFDRGSIYFTNKDGTLISAATLQTGFLIAINPQTLANPDGAFSAISSVASSSLSLDHDAFLADGRKEKSGLYRSRAPSLGCARAGAFRFEYSRIAGVARTMASTIRAERLPHNQSALFRTVPAIP